jgi:hypothetical protein
MAAQVLQNNEMHRSRKCRTGSLRSITLTPGPVISNVMLNNRSNMDAFQRFAQTFAIVLFVGLAGCSQSAVTPSLFLFEDLTKSNNYSSFAYWILVERKPLPDDLTTPNSLCSWMSYHYDVEEQAYSAEMLQTNDKLLPDYVRLIAPVTLAEKWTPFSVAQLALGPPDNASRTNASRSAAVAVWQPKPLDGFKLNSRNRHARHFVDLLKLACEIAIQESGRVIIVGEPGWSYKHWEQGDRMASHTVELMKAAGYLYTDRIGK